MNDLEFENFKKLESLSTLREVPNKFLNTNLPPGPQIVNSSLNPQPVFDIPAPTQNLPVQSISIEPPEETSFAGDLGNSFGIGSNALLKGVGGLSKFLGLDSVGKSLVETGQEGIDHFSKKLSPDASQRLAVPATKDADNFAGFTVNPDFFDWKTFALHLAQTAPSTVVSGGGGALATKGLAKLGASPKIAGMLGFGGAEGTLEAGNSAQQVEEAIRNAPVETLRHSPRFQDFVNNHFSEEEAREQLVKELANDAAIKSGAATFLLGVPFHGFLGNIAAGNAKGGVPRNALIGGLKEGAQEARQSGAVEAINAKTEQQAGIDTDAWRRFQEGFVKGGALGVPSGAALAAGVQATSANQPKAIEPQTKDFQEGEILQNDDGSLSIDIIKPKKKEELLINENDIDSLPPKTTLEGTEANLLQDVDQTPFPAKQPINGKAGSPTTVKTVSGELPGKYAIVEASSLNPSHDPFTFNKNPNYSLDRQERNYDTDKQAQLKVIDNTQKFDPGFLLNTDNTAVNGPPVVTKDGTVLGGNGRTMTLQRFYRENNRNNKYSVRLRNSANQFGLDPKEVSKFENPVLVRLLEGDPETVEAAQILISELNRGFTAELSDTEQAVSSGRNLSADTINYFASVLDGLADKATIKNALGKQPFQIIKRMLSDKVLTVHELPGLVDQRTQKFTDKGKIFAENALLGTVIPDSQLLDAMPTSARNKISRALPSFAQINARNNQFTLNRELIDAVLALTEMRAKNLEPKVFLAQQSFLEEGLSPKAEALFNSLVFDKPTAFAAKMKRISNASSHFNEGQDSFLPQNTPDQAFEEVFINELNSRTVPTKEELVKNPRTGEDFFGEISSELSDQIFDQSSVKIESGKIILRKGNQQFGKQKIDGKHLNNIKKSGFETSEQYIDFVVNNFNEINQINDDKLMLVVRNGRPESMVLELRRDEGQYSVVSAFTRDLTTLNNMIAAGKVKPLWKGAQIPQTSPETTSPLTTPSLQDPSGQTAHLDNKGQSGSSTNINPEEKNVKKQPEKGAPNSPDVFGPLKNEEGSIQLFREDQLDVTREQTLANSKAREVLKVHEETSAMVKDAKKFSTGKAIKALRAAMTDVSGNVKKQLIEEAGDAGKRVVMKQELAAGASAEAKRQFDGAWGKIYKGLSKDTRQLLGFMIESRRIVAIDAYRDDIKHPGGLTGADHQELLDALPSDVKKALNPLANKYFAEMKNQLTQLHKAGLINEKQFNDLADKGDYSPRIFLNHIDPEQTFTFGGNKITVRSSGIKSLDEGSMDALEKDSQLLLADVIGRVQARIFKNNANQELYKFAKENPGNTIVRVGGRAGPRETTIDVMVDGQNKRLIMDESLGKEWILSDPAINPQLAFWGGWLSGAKILRATATGFNPEFALSNLPRDLFHIYFTTTEYSPHLPIAPFQMGVDLATVASDAIFRKGRWENYIKQGGGMNFLTNQGEVFSGKNGTVLNGMQNVLGYLGETSELLTRLAVRERALKNGKTPEQATHVARSYLDFHIGGSAVKAVNTAVPYINASVQATSGLVRAAKQNPVVFTNKIIQLGAFSSALLMANMLTNDEAWESIPDVDKRNYFIFTSPIYETDKDGNKRFAYFRIPKDQGQRLASTVFEALTLKYFGKEIDTDQVIEAAKDMAPIMPTGLTPPALDAILGYANNQDFFRNKKIWDDRFRKIEPEEEFLPWTHPAYVKLGETTGLSPQRTRYAVSQFFVNSNPLMDAVGWSTRLMMDELPDNKEREWIDKVNFDIPFVRRFMRFTKPFNVADRKKLKKARVEADTKAFKEDREFRRLFGEFESSRDSKEIKKFIGKLEPERRKRFVNKFKKWNRLSNVKNLTYRKWWMELSHLNNDAKAIAFWQKWREANKAEKEELQKTARRIPSFATKGFLARFNRLRRNDENFKKKNKGK